MRLRANTTFAALCLLALAAGGCAHVDATREGPVIKKLDIEGTQAVKKGEIEKRILTAQTGKIPVLSKKQRFDPNVWRSDLRRIERYYRERGYYQARVVGDEVKPVGNDAVALSVKVDEGEPTVVSTVDIHGLDALPKDQRDALLGDVPLKQGQVFIEDKWEGLKGELEHHLKELGYAEAQVNGQAVVDLETRRAEVHVVIDPGVRYKFGDVVVHQRGKKKVEDWRIEEQAKEALEGEPWYSETARAEAQGRVFKMGVFGAAKAVPGQGDPATGRIPIDVEVQESAFHVLQAGVGAGLEQNRNDLHAIGKYTDRDFLGGLRKLDLDLRAGWAFLPNAYTVSTGGDRVTKTGPIAKLTGDLTQPRLWSPDWGLVEHLELERALEPAYVYSGGREKIGVAWQPKTWLSITPTYNFEYYRLDEGTTSLYGTAPQLLFGCPTNCVLSYLEQKLEVDKRDDKQEPHKGWYAGLSFQEGGGPLGGNFAYLRVLPEARGYVSVLEDQRLTFSGRVKFGTLIPGSGDATSSPIVARFFSGGNDMRGFSTRRLSPMYVVSIPNARGQYNAEPLPIGGNGLFESQLEARYALTGPLVVAAFFDTGMVTEESFQFRSFEYVRNNLQYAIGAGIRYRTPVGPVRLDLAYRPPWGPPLQVTSVDPTLQYAASQGCFGIGHGNPNAAGAPESPCSIHLSIGEAF